MMDPYSNISDLPEPFIFNCWKHHLKYLKDQIILAGKSGDDTELRKGMVKMGNSQIDLYIGTVSPKDITMQIASRLKKLGLMDTDPYLQWIYENPDQYQKIQINDNSWWTMKEGNLYGRHVHIHPGRYSPHTIRVKAQVLKTAITVSYLSDDLANGSPAIEDVNYARTKMLDLPPIKGIMKNSEASRVLELFRAAFRK